VFDHANLRVVTTRPERLLSMAVRVARATRDTVDLRLLLGHLSLRTVTDVEAVVARFFPDDPLSERSRMLLEGRPGVQPRTRPSTDRPPGDPTVS